MKYSNDQKMDQYIESGIKNKQVTFEFEGVIFWHMYKFYDFMNSTNAKEPFSQYLTSLIEGYIEENPGEYKFEFGEQSIPFSTEKHGETYLDIKDTAIHF
ncbi:hypothetical protein [Alkalibacillus salilacus]|uniref:Uncharacterized protein n=1 Tax=Alkalibacillus salilacus TaxID=284582 RepID=A0ABT9VD98_9BACI|nr:hypothetical protein [Alkalibacillus salilacus]MDQ0158947.1 hypothetical protein [Alkalibacillus salilacus]